MPHEDLRLLAKFEARDEWILEPGDILYIPPRVAHNGIAVGDDCMTYSIGFRAPGRSELIAHWCDEVLANVPDDDRYEDPVLQPQDNPGEITPAAIAELHAMAIEKMLDRDRFARWFGEYNSARKYPEIDWKPDRPVGREQLLALVARGVPLSRNPASRFSFIRRPTDGVLLFVDGECFECTRETTAWAEQLCSRAHLTIDPELMASSATLDLLEKLCNLGSVAFDEEN